MTQFADVSHIREERLWVAQESGLTVLKGLSVLNTLSNMGDVRATLVVAQRAPAADNHKGCPYNLITHIASLPKIFRHALTVR